MSASGVVPSTSGPYQDYLAHPPPAISSATTQSAVRSAASAATLGITPWRNTSCATALLSSRSACARPSLAARAPAPPPRYPRARGPAPPPPHPPTSHP